MIVLTQNAANKIIEMRALLHWCSFLIWNSLVFSSSQGHTSANTPLSGSEHWISHSPYKCLPLLSLYHQYYSVNPQLPENICDKSCYSTVAFANRKPSVFDPASTLGSNHGYTKLLTCFRPHLVIPFCHLCKTHSQESHLYSSQRWMIVKSMSRTQCPKYGKG